MLYRGKHSWSGRIKYTSHLSLSLVISRDGERGARAPRPGPAAPLAARNLAWSRDTAESGGQARYYAPIMRNRVFDRVYRVRESSNLKKKKEKKGRATVESGLTGRDPRPSVSN